MDLALTEEQEALQASARDFVRNETSPELARDPDGEDAIQESWTRMIALGWPAVSIPQEQGGAGMSIIELLILLEEIGRGIVPGPFFATAGQFVPALLAAAPGASRDQWLERVASGTTATVALGEDRGVWAWQEGTTSCTSVPGGWKLSGQKKYVLEGAHSDEILILARTNETAGPGGFGLFIVPGSAVQSEKVESLDPSLRLAHLSLQDVEVSHERVLAEPGTAQPIVERCLLESTVGAAALILGTCSSILDQTVEYAKTREQFDKPIGSFQAVKHKLTDMYVAVERARALTYFAGLTLYEEDSRREMASSMAKAAAGDCQRLLVQDGLQLHGGIGYTWEFDLHLYLKRATSLESLLGSSRMHRKRVASGLGLASRGDEA